MRPAAPIRMVGIAALLAAAAGIVAVPLVSLTIDDAFITFRQAQRLADGQFSYNFTTSVEASSSLLSTLILAVLDLAGVEPEVASKLIGILSMVLCGAVTAWLITARQRESPDVSAWAWLLPFAAVMTAPWVSAWWFMGLETPMWTLILLAAAVAVTLHLDGTSPRAFEVAVVACVAGTLTRPEAPLLLGLWLVGLAIIVHRGRRSLLALLAVVGATAVAVGIFRLQVYGYWFPNPVYVKAPTTFTRTAIEGTWYLLHAIVQPLRAAPLQGTLATMFIVLAGAPWLSAWRAAAVQGWSAEWQQRLIPALGLALLQLAFAVSVGGDWMPWGRFLVPALPLLAVAWTSPGAPSLARPFALLIFGGVVITAALFVRTGSEHGALADMRQHQDSCWKPMASYLRQQAEAGETLAAGDIGLPGYGFPGDVIDFFGLANPEMAHRVTGGAADRRRCPWQDAELGASLRADRYGRRRLATPRSALFDDDDAPPACRPAPASGLPAGDGMWRSRAGPQALAATLKPPTSYRAQHRPPLTCRGAPGRRSSRPRR